MNASGKGLDQWLVFDREDYLSLGAHLDRAVSVRYWPDFSVERHAEKFSTVEELDRSINLGLSPRGIWGQPSIGIEFEPFISISQRQVNNGYLLELSKAGIPVLSLGGNYEKTGEIITGRLSFSLRFQVDGISYDFREKARNYEKIIDLAEEMGAIRRKQCLIGPIAWSKYKEGVKLVLQTGSVPYKFDTD